MTSALRSTRSLLIVASLTIGACSSDQLGVHQLVLEKGETEGTGECWSLGDDGGSLTIGDRNPFDSDDDYRRHYEMANGKARIRIFVRSEPGHEPEDQGSPPLPPGKLALDVELDMDRFDRDDVLRDSFETRDGVAHDVYTWTEADCENRHNTLPQWVLDSVGDP